MFIVRSIAAVVGLVLGGLLGGGCGYWINSAIGRSQWIRANGIVYDLITVLVVLAPYVGLCAGAVGGAWLLLELAGKQETDRHNVSHTASSHASVQPDSELS